MIDVEKILGGLIRQSLKGSRLGGREEGVAINLSGSGFAQVAGLGALGVAMQAFEHYASQKSEPPPDTLQPPKWSVTGKLLTPSPPPSGGARAAAAAEEAPQVDRPAPQFTSAQALLLVRAMVAAARADGTIDAAESQAVLDYLEEGRLTAQEREFAQRVISAPTNVDSLIPEVRDDQLARQFYAVSLMAIRVDTQAEQDYMKRLRERLDLDDSTVSEIEASLGKTMDA